MVTRCSSRYEWAVFLTIFLAISAGASAQGIDLRLAVTRAPDAGRNLINGLATEIRARLPDLQLRVSETPEPIRQVLTDVRTGAIALAILPLLESGATLAEPAVQPWQYQTADEVNRALSSEIGAIAAAQLEQTGVYALAFTTVAFSRLATARPTATTSETESLALLRGRRVLTGPAQSQSSRVMTQLGAQPTPVPAGDVYPALERGLADAAIVVADAAFMRSGFADLLTNYVDQPYQPIAIAIVVNKAIWRSLPYGTQVALSEAARSVASGLPPTVNTQEQEFRAFLLARNATLVQLTAEGKARARQASFAAWSEANPQSDLLTRAVAASQAPRAVPGAAPGSAGQQTIFFATDRALENRDNPTLAFGGKSTTALSFGSVKVNLKDGRALDDDLEKVALLTSISHLAKDDFKSALRQETGDLAIFIHGYNNTFADAVRRAATAKADFGLAGPVVVFSWPSDGAAPAYFSDEAALEVTSINFREFLNTIDQVRSPSKTSIVAHSMGSRILLNYFDWAHGRPEFASREKFKCMLYAASDVTMLHFQAVRAKLAASAQRVTLYVSSYDRPLYVSETMHSDIRVGRAVGAAMFIDSVMDSIDASDIDNDGFFSTRHSYVFDRANGVKDVAALLSGKAASARTGLERRTRGQNDIYYRIIP
jgi:esterase/lipase superfamily enzyme